MKTIKDYLKDNDGQTLVGSLLQYGYSGHEIYVAEQAGIIRVKDVMVYLIPDETRGPGGCRMTETLERINKRTKGSYVVTGAIKKYICRNLQGEIIYESTWTHRDYVAIGTDERGRPLGKFGRMDLIGKSGSQHWIGSKGVTIHILQS